MTVTIDKMDLRKVIMNITIVLIILRNRSQIEATIIDLVLQYSGQVMQTNLVVIMVMAHVLNLENMLLEDGMLKLPNGDIIVLIMVFLKMMDSIGVLLVLVIVMIGVLGVAVQLIRI